MIPQQPNERCPILQRDFVHFATREDRPRYLSRRYAPYLAQGRILDVGCDTAVVRGIVGAERYTGVDLTGQADVRQNLQQEGVLPFNDESYDTVLCCDVLEHLDNLHQIFDECVRVAAGYVLISLPNNWNAARVRLRRGRGSFEHYGLPHDPPMDRHRWFFGLHEARDFLLERGRRHGLNILEMVALEKPRPKLVRALRRLRYPGLQHYLNLYTHTVVCMYEKGSGNHR